MKQFLLACAALLLTTTAVSKPIAQQVQQSIDVVVTYPGLNQSSITLTYSQPVRLNVLLKDATENLSKQQFARINWSKARLGSDKLNRQFAKKRENVDSKLASLERFWRNRGNYTYVNGIDFIREQLNDQTYFPSFYMGLEFDRTRIVLQENPLLTARDGSTFYLRLPTGGLEPSKMGLDKVSDTASATYAFVIATNGTIAKKPIGLYNKGKPGQCYSHHHSRPLNNKSTGLCDVKITRSNIILLNDFVMAGKHKNLNLEIAELMKFVVGASQ